MSDGTNGDDPWADDAYQPTGADDEQGDANELDMEDAVGEDDYDTILDRGYSPPERPYAVDRTGTTDAEQHEGESLDERLAEEVPDDQAGDLDAAAEPGSESDAEADVFDPGDPEAGDQRSGRLVAPNEGLEGPVDDDIAAADVGVDDASATAEEAAVHEIDNPE
jgi:Family of unknown function (DUF5709)